MGSSTTRSERVTLAVLRDFCEQYVPQVARHDSSLEALNPTWWFAHELGHLLTTERWRHQRPDFGLSTETARAPVFELRCRELAAMSVSERLLRNAGHHELARQEYDETDLLTATMDDRGRVRRILRHFGVLRLPRTRSQLERKIRAATGS